ncbi:hypothetical protein H2248_005567 [Termitomyces sp. 'cryptogamus']|nr:hypothetical protein H2248_005567 [Termitomyces sp. 'cryptogamus']
MITEFLKIMAWRAMKMARKGHAKARERARGVWWVLSQLKAQVKLSEESTPSALQPSVSIPEVPCKPSSSFSSTVSKSPALVSSALDTSSPFLWAEEPAFNIIKSLLDKFLPHCQQFGFFLNPNRFREATLLPLSFGHASRPTPAVLSAVYLWGVHLSQSEVLLQQEPSFILRALHHSVTDIFGSHPDVILHTLQAEILLSYYLLHVGRFVEAKCHTATAVSLALGAGLHKTKSTYLIPSILGLSSDAPVLVPLPRDTIEEGERINGFWAVLVLHKYITVALEPPTSVCGTLEAPGMQVDTPWPLDIWTSEGISPEICGNDTIQTFLLDRVERHPGTSLMALNAKAAILFHRSAQLAGQWVPNMQPQKLQAYTIEFLSTHRLTETFRSILPPLTHLDIKHPAARILILAHALTDAAMIKLHINFSSANSSSNRYCLEAARRITTFGGFSILEVGYINPIMNTLLAEACSFLIQEISRMRLSGNMGPENVEGNEDELLEHLRNGVEVLSAQSDESIFTKYQLKKTQEALSTI